MGNTIRLLVLATITLIFIALEESQRSVIFILYLFIISALSFPFFYFVDFNPPFGKKKKKVLEFENDIKEACLKEKMYLEIKFSLVANKLNWFVLLFPLVFLFFVKTNDFNVIDIIFSSVIFLHLVLNITVLSILIRNYYKKFYIPYIVLIGVVFQIFSSLFRQTKINLFWFSVVLVVISFALIAILSFRISKIESSTMHNTHV